MQDKGCNHVSVDVQKRSAALFDWLVAGTLQSSMQTGIHITVPAYCLLRYLLRRWMGKHHQQQPWPWLGFYISTFARLLTLDCIHVRTIDTTQYLGSRTILFNPLGEPNCQWNKTCNLETSTLNIPMNFSRL